MSYADYEWFLKADLSKYSGKWVAIQNKKVIASAKNSATIIKEAKDKFPNKRPFITKIKSKLSIL